MSAADTSPLAHPDRLTPTWAGLVIDVCKLLERVAGRSAARARTTYTAQACSVMSNTSCNTGAHGNTPVSARVLAERVYQLVRS